MAPRGNAINFSLEIPGKENVPDIKRTLTLGRLVEWIKAQGKDEYTTTNLIKLASNYPSHALPSFKKNFNLMLQRVQVQRRKEDPNATTKEEAIVREKEDREETVKSLEDGLNKPWGETSKPIENQLNRDFDSFDD